MTVLGYFNALRELGGSRRIIEDEVSTRVADYGNRLRVGETDGCFANRSIAHEVLELTSREPTNRVADEAAQERNIGRVWWLTMSTWRVRCAVTWMR